MHITRITQGIIAPFLFMHCATFFNIISSVMESVQLGAFREYNTNIYHFTKSYRNNFPLCRRIKNLHSLHRALQYINRRRRRHRFAKMAESCSVPLFRPKIFLFIRTYYPAPEPLSDNIYLSYDTQCTASTTGHTRFRPNCETFPIPRNLWSC